MPNSEWIKIGLTPCLPSQNQVILNIYCHNFMLRSQWCLYLSTSVSLSKLSCSVLSSILCLGPYWVDYLFLDLMQQMTKLPPEFICLTVIIPVLKICMDGNRTVSEFAPSCWDIAFPQKTWLLQKFYPGRWWICWFWKSFDVLLFSFFSNFTRDYQRNEPNVYWEKSLFLKQLRI